MWEKPGGLYLDFILFLLPKAKENISELLADFIVGEQAWHISASSVFIGVTRGEQQ